MFIDYCTLLSLKYKFFNTLQRRKQSFSFVLWDQRSTCTIQVIADPPTHFNNYMVIVIHPRVPLSMALPIRTISDWFLVFVFIQIITFHFANYGGVTNVSGFFCMVPTILLFISFKVLKGQGVSWQYAVLKPSIKSRTSVEIQGVENKSYFLHVVLSNLHFSCVMFVCMAA